MRDDEPPAGEKWCECEERLKGVKLNDHADGWIRCRGCQGLYREFGNGDPE